MLTLKSLGQLTDGKLAQKLWSGSSPTLTQNSDHFSQSGSIETRKHADAAIDPLSQVCTDPATALHYRRKRLMGRPWKF